MPDTTSEIFELDAGFDFNAFLREYWQKKPVVIRGFCADATEWLEADELAGMASEPSIESRIALENGGEYPWQVLSGPFEDQFWPTLADKKWSLLVQGVERWVPSVSEARERFRFVPDWRMDDVMVSYAPKGASIGAHWDHYDVFLIQGKGRRRWNLSTSACKLDAPILRDVDLKILKDFVPDASVILEPGDVLYVPPLFAHHGLSELDSLTYSVGFRAPTVDQMLRSFADFCSEKIGESVFYTDPDLKLQKNPAQISAESLEKLRKPILELIQNKSFFKEWLGMTLTSPKAEDDEDPKQIKWTDFSQLSDDCRISRREGRKFAWIDAEGDDSAWLFCEGECWSLPTESSLQMARLLGKACHWSWEDIKPLVTPCEKARAIFIDLIQRQWITVSVWDEWED